MSNYLNTCFYEIIDRPEFMKGLQRAVNQLPPQGIFSGDNLFTIQRNLSFLDDAAFMQSFEKNTHSASGTQQEIARAVIWRCHVHTWAASNCLRLEGDFVECASDKGVSAKIVCDYLSFNQTGKSYYLYDSFEDGQAMDPSATSEQGSSSYEQVSQSFLEYPNVHVIRGSVPEILHTHVPEKIAFLRLNINNTAAETGALESLFDRVVTGGIMILDAYGWLAYKDRQQAESNFFAERGHRVLELPTGQGLVVKFN